MLFFAAVLTLSLTLLFILSYRKISYFGHYTAEVNQRVVEQLTDISSSQRIDQETFKELIKSTTQSTRRVLDRLVDKMTVQFGGLILLLLIGTLYLMGWFLIRYFQKPMEALTEAAAVVEKGNLQTQVTIFRNDEIGRLARAFNKMVSSLQKAEQLNVEYSQSLEAKVAARTNELRKANREMEDLLFELTREVNGRKQAEQEKEETIKELEAALERINVLSGLVPICASCKKIRDDQGFWNHLEVYLMNHSDIVFSHGICPDCAQKLYPELYQRDKKS